jgi:cell division protease FtsH
MAPKDNDSRKDKSLSQRLTAASSSNDHEEQETTTVDNNPNNDNKKESWNKRFARHLQTLLANLRTPESKRRLILALGTTVLTLVGYRYRQRSRVRHQQRLPVGTTSTTLMLRSPRPDYRSAVVAPLSLLYRALREEQIQRAWMGSASVYYQVTDGSWKQSLLPSNSPGMQQELLETLSKTCQTVSVLPDSLASRAATPLLAALPFVYLIFLYRMMSQLSDKGDPHFSAAAATTHDDSTSAAAGSTTFRDVAGMDEVLQQVREVVAFLRNPTRYEALGARAPAGILLHGPPGSGKTLTARAVAGEAAVDAFIACSASEFCELYVGRGAARVRSLFAQARSQAKQNAAAEPWWKATLRRLLPLEATSSTTRRASAIIFIDELDALAKTRGSAGSWNSNDEREQTLNQLLTELDGFAVDPTVTVIVMAASNRADVLDPAVLRRMDRQVYVGYPNAAGREAIFKVHARRIECVAESINWALLAARSDGFSGADLANAVNEAALLAVRESCTTVQQNHLEHAVRRIRQMKNNLSATGGATR